MLILLTGWPWAGSLTASTDTPDCCVGSRCQSEPGLKGMVCPAAAKKGEEKSPPSSGDSSPLLFACGVLQLWENSGRFFTPKDAILLTSVKSKLLSTSSDNRRNPRRFFRCYFLNTLQDGLDAAEVQ